MTHHTVTEARLAPTFTELPDAAGLSPTYPFNEEQILRIAKTEPTLRDMLQNEGARVQREIVEYATLSQAAMQSTKIIAESLTHWKKVPDAPSIRE